MSQGISSGGTSGQVVLLELAVPTLQLLRANYQSGTVTTNYGTGIWGGRHDAGRLGTGSCYWDEDTQQLFWFSQLTYHDSGSENIIGITTLNDAVPASSVSRGRFRLSGFGVKATKGAMSIPPAYRSEFGGNIFNKVASISHFYKSHFFGFSISTSYFYFFS
jgi:hypothetical protein